MQHLVGERNRPSRLTTTHNQCNNPRWQPQMAQRFLTSNLVYLTNTHDTFAGIMDIDPQLLQTPSPLHHSQTQSQGDSLTILSRSRGNSDREGNDSSNKRQKLNLLKCKQCREARKKVSNHSRSHSEIQNSLLYILLRPTNTLPLLRCSTTRDMNLR